MAVAGHIVDLSESEDEHADYSPVKVELDDEEMVTRPSALSCPAEKTLNKTSRFLFFAPPSPLPKKNDVYFSFPNLHLIVHGSR